MQFHSPSKSLHVLDTWNKTELDENCFYLKFDTKDLTGKKVSDNKNFAAKKGNFLQSLYFL